MMRIDETPPTITLTFDSMEDFVRELPARGRYERDSWTGNVSYARAKEMCFTGDPTILADMVRGFDLATQSIDLPTPQLRAGMVGFVPNVPAVLACEPETMLYLEQDDAPRQAVKVVYDTTSSGGFKATELRKRGCAFLGFYEQLRMLRPVELWVSCSLGSNRDDYHSTVCLFPIPPTTDLAVLGYMFAHAAFPRMLCYEFMMQKHGANGKWACNKPGAPIERLIREVYQLTPDDVLVPPCYLYDPLMQNPREWVTTNLARFTPQRVDEWA